MKPTEVILYSSFDIMWLYYIEQTPTGKITNMSEKDTTKVDIGGFIDDNSNLFVVLGVFSALAIYISQLQDGRLIEAPLQTRVGFVGSLVLAALTITTIFKQLISEIGSIDRFVDSLAKTQNWDLLVFTAGFTLLTPAILAPLLEYQSGLYWALALIMFFFTFALIIKTISKLYDYIPETALLREGTITILGLVLFASSTWVLNFMLSESIPIGTQYFSISTPLPLLFDVIALDILIIQFISGLVFSLGFLKFVYILPDRLY